MAEESVNSKGAVLCPRCKGDGAVLRQLPNQTESTYGWAGYVPCPRCGGCGHVRFGLNGEELTERNACALRPAIIGEVVAEQADPVRVGFSRPHVTPSTQQTVEELSIFKSVSGDRGAHQGNQSRSD